MSDNDDDDELFEQLEAEMEKDGTFDFYRKKKILEFQDTIQQRENLEKKFKMFNNEKDLLDTIDDENKQHKDKFNYIIVFINENFKACQVLVEQLKENIRTSRGEYSAFVIQAVNSPFLVSKLNIKVLPTMVAYTNGTNVGQHIGLEGLLNDPRDVYTLNDAKLSQLVRSYFLNGDGNF